MKRSKVRRAFQRPLPGGGFVAIDVVARQSMFRAPRYDGWVVVERRAHPRGHPPPVVARATGGTIDSVVQQLLPAAENNPSIAAGLLRHHRLAAV
jgi:hypothetical protein